MNACTRQGKMVSETFCRQCCNWNCRHAGELTIKEKLELGIVEEEINNG